MNWWSHGNKPNSKSPSETIYNMHVSARSDGYYPVKTARETADATRGLVLY